MGGEGNMIGNKVAIFRKAKEKSLEQVARVVGADRSHISKIEKGLRCAGPELMFKLARYFDCKIEDLFFLKDD
jgi:putative transcriptional regulator